MFIKLGIIASILILGCMIFSDKIDILFPTTSASVIDSLKTDVSNFDSKASDSVEKRIDDSIDKIMDKTGESISNEISQDGNEISEVKKSSQKIISEEISNLNPIESIKNIFVTNSTSQNSKSTVL